MPQISVIIPFNNVEGYIEECLKSVSEQTFSDMEAILINDASKDNSRAIAEKYSEKDSRFKIIDLKEQMGQGYARNRGIEAASGKYICFADSDDFLEPEMFEKLYNASVKDDTDITMCQSVEYDDLNKKYINSDYYSLSILGRFKDSVFSAADTKNELLDINVSLWNKIYKSSYLKQTGGKFPEGFIYEDLPFFFGVYTPAKRINIVWEKLYNYRVNRRNSTMMQFNNKILDRIPMVSMTLEKIKQLPYYSEIKNKVQGWVINDLFHRYTLLKENYYREFFFLMKKVFKSLEIENIDDAYWKTVYYFKGYQLVINNSFEDFCRKMFKEYLDIHEVENRLRSEFSYNSDTDRRFNLIYEEINKNYKYTEELCGRIKQELQNKEALQAVQTEINKISEAFAAKISEMQEKLQFLYNDNKDLSYIMHNNNSEMLENIAMQNRQAAELKKLLDIQQKEFKSALEQQKLEYEKQINDIKESIKELREKERDK